LLYAWGARDKEAWQESQEEQCRGQNWKEGTVNIFPILQKAENVFIASLKIFWRFLKVNPGGA